MNAEDVDKLGFSYLALTMNDLDAELEALMNDYESLSTYSTNSAFLIMEL